PDDQQPESNLRARNRLRALGAGHPAASPVGPAQSAAATRSRPQSAASRPARKSNRPAVGLLGFNREGGRRQTHPPVAGEGPRRGLEMELTIRCPSAPSPLVGEGWGGGYLGLNHRMPPNELAHCLQCHSLASTGPCCGTLPTVSLRCCHMDNLLNGSRTR